MAGAQNTTGTAARSAAVEALNLILGQGAMLAELGEPNLPPADRARARRLIDEVLRKLEPIDRVLSPFLRKSPPLAVRNILRLAVAELSSGTAAHGVVNSAVSIARMNKKTSHSAGLINAVLRQIDPEALAKQPVQKLPRWLRQPLVHAWGRDAVAMIEQVQAQTPPLDLSLRSDTAPEGELLPTKSLRLHDFGQVSALKGYAEGAWWVQDAAAALPAKVLQAQKGEKVLDLCAAPGGKTLQMASAGAEVTALDISEHRVTRLRENLSRMGLSAQVVVADALAWEPSEKFDAILLDAPCSATGTIRRHPDLPFAKDGSEVAPLAELQAQLLDRALGWLKPNGRIVFATCSLLPAEGEDQLSAVLERHPNLIAEKVEVEGIDPSWWSAANGLRLRPDYWADKGGMDGFFVMRLRYQP